MGVTELSIWAAIFADGLAGLAGGLLPERWLRRYLSTLVAFAAGALLGAVFLSLLPETLAAEGPAALGWMLASLVAMALLEWAMGRRRGEPSVPLRTLPLSLLGADALHNVGDGAAVAAAFLVSQEAGVATALAVIAHEVPQEVGDYGLLRAAGMSRAWALFALAAVQLTAAVGAAGVLLGARVVEDLQGVVLAVASGTFLYIALVDLLPAVKAQAGWGPVGGLLAGVGLLLLLTLLETHLGVAG